MVWLSWLGIVPETKRSPVRFPVRVYAWVEGPIPSWGTHGPKEVSQSMFLSHIDISLSLSPCLAYSLKPKKKKKKNLIKKHFFKEEKLGLIQETERWAVWLEPHGEGD